MLPLFLLLEFLIPALSVILVAIDVFRTGASRWWIFMALAFPVLGSLAYLVVVRILAQDGSGVPWIEGWQHRKEAQKRCRELQLRLSHWRAPGLVAELAKEKWALGKKQEADALYREAVENLQDRPDVYLERAECLLALGRDPEALALLEKTEATWPAYKPTEVKLLISRCLPNNHLRLEPILRDALVTSTLPEPKIRLASLLAQKGQTEEAQVLAQQVQRESACWPSFFLRQNRRWLHFANKLAKGATPALPSAKALYTRDRRLKLALGAASLLLILALLGASAAFSVLENLPRSLRQVEETESLRAQLYQLNKRFPATDKEDLGQQELDRYIQARKALAQPLSAFLKKREENSLQLQDNGLVQLLAPSSAITAKLERDRAFLESAHQILQDKGLSPAQLRQIGDLAEWRFLRRTEAKVFALSYSEWAQLQNIHRLNEMDTSGTHHNPYLEPWRDEMYRKERQKTTKELETRLEALRLLNPGSLCLLEKKRAELQTLPVEGLDLLAFLLEHSLERSWRKESASAEGPKTPALAGLSSGASDTPFHLREKDETTHTHKNQFHYMEQLTGLCPGNPKLIQSW